MKTTKCLIVMMLLLAGLLNSAKAQQLLTLEKTLEIAYENSPDIRDYKLALVQSRERLNLRQARLKSNISLTVNPLTYENNRRFDEFASTWYTTKTTNSSSTFQIVQPIKATDGTISLYDNFGWQSSYSDATDVTSKTFSNDLYLTFTQPLFTYNSTKLDLKTLELDLETALLNYAMQKLNIERSVSQYFYQVYQQQQSLDISREELSNQQQSYDIIKNKVDAGLSAKEELWQAELNLANARSGVYNSEVNLENAKDQLKQTIGMDLTEEISVIANVEVKTIDVNMQDAIDYALQHRMELRQMEINIEQAQFSMIQAKATNEFKGDVSLTLGLSGQDQEIQKIYDVPRNNQRVNLSFDIPIWDWGVRKSTIKLAETDINRTEYALADEQISIRMNIRQIYRNLQNLVYQIDIARKSVENARLTYELNLEKYENGDLTSMDLSLYQNQLSSQRNEYTNALISYKLELLNLKIQSLWDFEARKSIVPSEYAPEFDNIK